MDLQQRTRRFGIYVILCACILRFSLAGESGIGLWRLAEENNLPFLTYLETGRNVRFSASADNIPSHSRESPGPWLPEPARPVFGGEDVQWLEVEDGCGRQPDLAALLAQPLDWNLAGEEPRVLILHTHTTESYTKDGEVYEETTRYRTLEEDYNMLSIGDAVAQVLEEAGIGVIHDRTMHDYPSYNGAYAHARKSTEAILEQNPSICLVLDLHRDASAEGGIQYRTEAVAAGEPSAQLMFVMGTDASHSSHENWQENLSLALKLQVLLSRENPGIVRPLDLRSQRFNQDLNPGALLVEVGAAGNTRQEALTAARALAEAVVCLARGTEDTGT